MPNSESTYFANNFGHKSLYLFCIVLLMCPLSPIIVQ